MGVWLQTLKVHTTTHQQMRHLKAPETGWADAVCSLPRVVAQDCDICRRERIWRQEIRPFQITRSVIKQLFIRLAFGDSELIISSYKNDKGMCIFNMILLLETLAVPPQKGSLMLFFFSSCRISSQVIFIYTCAHWRWLTAPPDSKM